MWEKIEPKSTRAWNTKQDGEFTLKEGDELIGKYVNKKEEVGANSSNVYEIETDEETVSVWGSTVLDSRFAELTMGDIVKIVYKGEVKSEKTGRNYRDYDVFRKKESEVAEEDIEDINKSL